MYVGAYSCHARICILFSMFHETIINLKKKKDNDIVNVLLNACDDNVLVGAMAQN